MTDADTCDFESVYIAGNVREAEAVEALFAEVEIEYQLRPVEFRHVISLGGAFAGVSFLVLPGQAPYCRFLLSDRGFRKGIVPSEQEQP